MLELRASVWLVTAVIRAAPPGTILVVFCDNTTAVAGLRRQRGYSWAANEALRDLAELLHQKKSMLDVRWVDTHRMIADGWTRLPAPPEGQVRAFGPRDLGELLQRICRQE